MNKAVLLGVSGPVGHGELDPAGIEPRDCDAEALHGALPGEARPDTLIEVRIFRLEMHDGPHHRLTIIDK